MIVFCFKEFDLGILSFDKEANEFVYDSLLENEKEAEKKYGLDFYSLKESMRKRSKTLFKQFNEFVDCLTRPDIIRLAKINNDDSLFEKLEKLSRLNLNDAGYFIRYKK